MIFVSSSASVTSLSFACFVSTSKCVSTVARVRALGSDIIGGGRPKRRIRSCGENCANVAWPDQVPAFDTARPFASPFTVRPNISASNGDKATVSAAPSNTNFASTRRLPSFFASSVAGSIFANAFAAASGAKRDVLSAPR